MIMTGKFTPEFKKEIIRRYVEEDCSYRTLAAECGVSKSTISKWYRKYSLECQTESDARETYDLMEERLRLKTENEELRNDVAILKKVVTCFIQEIC